MSRTAIPARHGPAAARPCPDALRQTTSALLLIVLDADALTAAGIPFERYGEHGEVGIGAPLPPTDPAIVRAVIPLHRDGDRWLAPDPQTVEDA